MFNFNVIIPTYGRPAEVVLRTLRSASSEAKTVSNHGLTQIILIDQNFPALNFNNFFSNQEYIRQHADTEFNLEHSNFKIIHFFGLNPSVTKAKNFGLKQSSGEFLFFLDDDVEVLPGSFSNFFEILQNPNIGFVAGKEILVPEGVGTSAWKSKLRAFVSIFQMKRREYMLNSNYVGYISEKGFFLCDYSLDSKETVEVDTARGCVWATKRQLLHEAGYFDESFKGSAIREEADLHLRIKQLGVRAVYSSKSAVYHYRQMGGCSNLSQTYSSFLSKLENESLFQKKHFAGINRVWFFVRLLPLAIEQFRSTWGLSFLILLQITLSKSNN